MSDLPFLVVGGGIAGLGAALGLSGLGAGVRLFEQAAAFEEVGAGLQMSPNGVRALQALGAWDAVEPSCVIPSEIHVKDGVSGALLQRIRLGKTFENRFGAPYRVCHRADLLAGLVATARNRPAIELRNSSAVTGVELAVAQAALVLDVGETAAGRAVIAADGIRSRLRQEVCGKVDPVHRGHLIHRGLIPLKSVPPEIEIDCVTLWLCPGGHVVHYPVSNWRSFNIVAAVDGTAAEGGWQQPAGSDEMMRHFPAVVEDLSALLAAVPDWRRWQGADLPELPRWSKGNLVLAGDAAHATLPYLAQGAVMALEDAVVLSQQVRTASSLGSAFTTYESLRRARTSRIQAQSRRMGWAYHARGATALARNAVLRLGGGVAVRQMEWIFGWSPDMIIR
ncbi:FAD-dependent monooxygenase [Aestuariivirga sp.]|uniref:FAD-dependent monooxygenase n=1 Tax=Aestuariivirga sp. TaxID=2650926 RepID=UPI003593077D